MIAVVWWPAYLSWLRLSSLSQNFQEETRVFSAKQTNDLWKSSSLLKFKYSVLLYRVSFTKAVFAWMSPKQLRYLEVRPCIRHSFKWPQVLSQKVLPVNGLLVELIEILSRCGEFIQPDALRVRDMKSNDSFAFRIYRLSFAQKFA